MLPRLAPKSGQRWCLHGAERCRRQHQVALRGSMQPICPWELNLSLGKAMLLQIQECRERSMASSCAQMTHLLSTVALRFELIRSITRAAKSGQKGLSLAMN